MKVFEDYSAYYDLLYKDKDYPAEAAYVLGLLRAHDPSISSLIDLGCGSGRHTVEFARQGLRVTGVDRSPDMLAEARRRSVGAEWIESDIVHYRAGRPVDAAVALFHVFSYLAAGEQIETFLANVAQSLEPGGLFLFDFWYGPAVLAQKPAVRVKRMESEAYEILRTAEPVLIDEKNIVEVHYTVIIRGKKDGSVQTITESHTMRYFFIPEVEQWLGRAGFRMLDRHEWMTGSALSPDTWSATVLAQRA